MFLDNHLNKTLDLFQCYWHHFSTHFPWIFSLLVGKLGKTETKACARIYGISRLYIYHKTQIQRDAFVLPQINNKTTTKLHIQANLFMNAKGTFAESFQQIPGKTNTLESSHDGLWEIYQGKKKTKNLD